MTPIVLLGHGALAVGVAFLAPWASVRDRAARVAAVVGIGLGVGALIEAAGVEPWRSATPAPDLVAVVSLAAAAAWLLVATRELGRERWRAAIGVGIAASGLLLFAGNPWVVPALLFWCIAIGALWVTLVSAEARAVSLVGGATVVAALLGGAVVGDSWRTPDPASWVHWMVVGAAVVNVALVPRFGPSAELSGRGVCALPLLVGAGLVLALGLGRGPHPWVALPLVGAGAGIAVWAVGRRALEGTAIVSWPAVMALGLVYAAPEAGTRAAAAGILGVTMVGLWPDAVGRARIGRAATLCLVPPAVGFGALAGAATESFLRAESAPTVAAGAPWLGIAALLPVALAAAIVLGAATARQEPSDDYEVPAVVATWSVLTGAIALGMGDVLPGPEGIRIAGALSVVVFAVGLGAAYLARNMPLPRNPDGAPPFELSPISAGARSRRALTWSGALLGTSAIVAVAWLTYRGLAVGFLQ